MQLFFILHHKCFSNSPRDIQCNSRMNNQKHWYTPYYSLSTNSAGIRALSTFKILADSCYACSKSITLLSGPSDDAIQVDELKAIGIYVVLKLCSRDTQLDHTFFVCIMPRFKSCRCWHNIRKPIPCSLHIENLLALCCDLKAADYAQNYAGIIFTSLFPAAYT